MWQHAEELFHTPPEHAGVSRHALSRGRRRRNGLARVPLLLAVTACCAVLAAAGRHESILSRGYRAQLIKQARVRIASRNAFLNASLPNERDGFSRAPLYAATAVSLLSPYYVCPYELTRSNLVSEEYEGGKWACGVLQIRERRCVVYSFGSCGNDVFERHIADNNANCEIHVFDPTSPPLERYHYHKCVVRLLCVCAGIQLRSRWARLARLVTLAGSAVAHTPPRFGICAHGDTFVVDGKDYPCKQLASIMRELGHSYVDVLKLDVEGSEWDILVRACHHRQPACMLAEHLPDWLPHVLDAHDVCAEWNRLVCTQHRPAAV